MDINAETDGGISESDYEVGSIRQSHHNPGESMLFLPGDTVFWLPYALSAYILYTCIWLRFINVTSLSRRRCYWHVQVWSQLSRTVVGGSFKFPTSQKDVKTPFEVLSQTLPIPPDTCTRRPEAKPRCQRANLSNSQAGHVSSPPQGAEHEQRACCCAVHPLDIQRPIAAPLCHACQFRGHTPPHSHTRTCTHKLACTVHDFQSLRHLVSCL